MKASLVSPTNSQLPSHQRQSSSTFREGSLMKQAGMFTFQLDKGASNYFNNKSMIQNTINNVKETRMEQNKFNTIHQSNDITDFRSSNGNNYANTIRNEDHSIRESKAYLRQKSLDNQQNSTLASQNQRSYQIQYVMPQSVVQSQKPFIKPNLFIQEKDLLKEFSFHEPHQPVITPAHATKTAYSVFSRDPNRTLSNFSSNIVQVNQDQAVSISINTSYRDQSAIKRKYELNKEINSKSYLEKHSANGFGKSVVSHTNATLVLAAGGSHRNEYSELTSPIRTINSSLGMGNNQGTTSVQTGQNSGIGERSNSQELSPTKESKDQYIKNRSQRPTTLNGPIDLFDIKTGLVSNKTYIQQQSEKVVQNVKTMKNKQSHFIDEPTTRVSFEKDHNDIINFSKKDKFQSESKGRKRYISQFYEQEKAPHFFQDYKQSVEKFPNLFSKKKTEFSKFTNAIPSSRPILRSTSFGLKDSKF
ncbi:UNKNOWN [Stylonychia lemnae]|uniref:Uncharacterized protein n=1 Tax=Stylonychia lemnae TaxID=5949 RepID=A0A078A2S0_STYLE|nr:UNKNOWN [Stylonychia lemnae]|eukprot:CDW76395.1 UNKNOWN [Stylonychia lemnae]